jgi:Activator of Hsp90 ATPase homolog 1-like protein
MITKSVLLPIVPAAAFRLFTEQISDWWPPDRLHTDDPASSLHLHVNGRFFVRASDGREVELGRVVEWLAPQRIVLDFYIATGPAHPTRAEISFVPEGTGTRVTVIHESLPASKDLWKDRAPRYELAWESVLAALLNAAVM